MARSFETYNSRNDLARARPWPPRLPVRKDTISVVRIGSVRVAELTRTELGREARGAETERSHFPSSNRHGDLTVGSGTPVTVPPCTVPAIAECVAALALTEAAGKAGGPAGVAA